MKERAIQMVQFVYMNNLQYYCKEVYIFFFKTFMSVVIFICEQKTQIYYGILRMRTTELMSEIINSICIYFQKSKKLT